MTDVREANASNNAKGDAARRRRWRPARAAAWALLGGLATPGARVAVAGAGNGDDLPLVRLARRAGRLDLLDLDPVALRATRRRVAAQAGPRRGRAVHAVIEDLTGGAADAIVAAAPGPVAGGAPAVPSAPVGDGPYDVVIADLVLSQLLYPGLRARDLSGGEIDAVLLRDGQRVTDGVVARLHAAAPAGVVVVLHDLLGWWDGHPQPFALEEVLALAAHDPATALRRARGGSLPYGCDPWLATRRAGARVHATRFWRWPFAPGADYLVCALVCGKDGAAGASCQT
jgi:hypothetical protein